MDREILFRGKLLRTGQWIEGYYCKRRETTYAFAEDYERHPVPTYHYIAVDEMTDWGLPNRLMLHEVDPDTVGQYTGLKDRNGKRIFEGDVLFDPHPSIKKHYTVIWEGGTFYRRTSNGHYLSLTVLNSTYFEVIGNIHDNPELLGGNDNGPA